MELLGVFFGPSHFEGRPRPTLKPAAPRNALILLLERGQVIATRTSPIAQTTSDRHRRGGHPPPWADTSNAVATAVINASVTTPAATATAPSARIWPALSGSSSGKTNCCPSTITTSSSPSPNPSTLGSCRIKPSSTGCCSRLPPPLYRPSPPTPNTSAPKSASSPSSTPGPPHLGLHTWGQKLLFHPHIHCVATGGGISPDGQRWVACRPGFFLRVRVLSRLFLEALEKAFRKNKFQFYGQLLALSNPAAFLAILAPLRKVEWVVYAKPPFGGPARVLEYLGRYTHRVALTNRRLLAVSPPPD